MVVIKATNNPIRKAWSFSQRNVNW
jgi:hypothetical protein